MAHVQQAQFCLSVKQRFPDFFSNRFVLDVGSLDINGNNQFLFEDCLYLGVDLAPGRNVDIVSKGHELALPDESLDVIVSTECFEHDQFYQSTLRNIARLLKPGGLFFFSCATTGRPEHGTRRTTPQDAPFIQGLQEWSDYYKNLDENDIRSALDLDSIFSSFEFSTNDESKDLYFWGVKRGELIYRNDYSFQINRQTLQEEVADLTKVVSGREEQITLLTDAISSQEEQISRLTSVLRNRDEQIARLQQEVTNLRQQIIKHDEEFSIAGQRIQALESDANNIRRSLSWQLTIPVRVAGRLFRGEFAQVWNSIRVHFNGSSDRTNSQGRFKD